MTLTNRDAQWRVERVPACALDSTEVKESIHIGGETCCEDRYNLPWKPLSPAIFGSYL